MIRAPENQNTKCLWAGPINRSFTCVLRLFWAFSQGELFWVFVHPIVLHFVVEFQDFWWHGLGGLLFLGASRCSFLGDPFRRSSVRGLPRATPTIFFDDFCTVGFLTGIAMIFLFAAPFYFEFFLEFPCFLVTPFSRQSVWTAPRYYWDFSVLGHQIEVCQYSFRIYTSQGIS